jgi:predicted transcriptional regulator
MAVKDKMSGHFIALQRETRKYNRRRGLYTRIAEELGVTPAHVRNCALGLRRSSRVEEALLRELSREAA